MNVTVPAGMPAAEVTVALSVTTCPALDGLGVEVRLVEVAAAAAQLNRSLRKTTAIASGKHGLKKLK